MNDVDFADFIFVPDNNASASASTKPLRITTTPGVTMEEVDATMSHAPGTPSDHATDNSSCCCSMCCCRGRFALDVIVIDSDEELCSVCGCEATWDSDAEYHRDEAEDNILQHASPGNNY